GRNPAGKRSSARYRAPRSTFCRAISAATAERHDACQAELNHGAMTPNLRDGSADDAGRLGGPGFQRFFLSLRVMLGIESWRRCRARFVEAQGVGYKPAG